MKGSFQWSMSKDEFNHHLMDGLLLLLGFACTLIAQWITQQDFGIYGNVLGSAASAGLLAVSKTYATNTFTPDNPPTRADVIDHDLKIKSETVPPTDTPSAS